jgi:hypothetical protein
MQRQLQPDSSRDSCPRSDRCLAVLPRSLSKGKRSDAPFSQAARISSLQPRVGAAHENRSYLSRQNAGGVAIEGVDPVASVTTARRVAPVLADRHEGDGCESG